MASYTYTISTDTANQKVDASRLHKEILESAGISQTLDGVFTDEDLDQLKIAFASVLSSGEETTLNSLVAAHTGNKADFWRMLCVIEGLHYATEALSQPTQCPINLTHSVTQVVKQQPSGIHSDETGAKQAIFVTSAQTLIIATVV